MKPIIKRLIRWTPRTLCILFAAFLSIFALDVLGGPYSLQETILALLIHLIPTWILLAVLAFSWRWEWVGAIAFTALGAWYLIASWGRFHWSAYAVISGPLFLLGLLFLVSWIVRTPRRGTN